MDDKTALDPAEAVQDTDLSQTPEQAEVDEKELEAAVESILFASGEPVHIDRICAALSLERPAAETILHRLSDYYAFERRGIRLLRMEESWQLCSSPDHGGAVRKAFEIRKTAKLSQPALEALTIVAYYQPTTRAYVDKLRGVDSGYTMGLLAERGLIEECGRLQVPGRPRLYRTTQKFLRSFHLNSLDDLPALPESGMEGQTRLEDGGGQQSAALPAVQPKITGRVPEPESIEEPPKEPETAPESTEEPPEEPESVPESTEEVPEEPESVPESTEETPEEPEGVSESTEEPPEEPEPVPESTEETPEEPETAPESTEEIPEEVESIPESIEEVPEESETAPESTEEPPEEPEVVPESIEEPPEEPEAVPESIEEPPEPDGVKKKTGSGPDTGSASADSGNPACGTGGKGGSGVCSC